MIKFQNVHKTYKNSGVDALRGVSFLIDEGEFVFIIGPSGSGKSTILKCMNCEERPNSGTVYIDGFPISDMSRALVPVLRRHIGMVFQDFRLIETKTVAENISFAGEIIGMSKKSLHQKVQLVLNIVGLKDRADAYPHELSGGQMQRVAIARAMLNNPKIIIADEPTGNLDPATSENIMALLLDINRSGTTVIVCTHDANMVDKMKKRVIEIEDGLVVRDQEDSAYVEQKSESGIPLPKLNVSFGDKSPFGEDEEVYHAGYEEEEVYVEEKPPVGDFYFGDTPKSMTVPAPAAVSVPTPAPAPAPAPVAFGESLMDVAQLPVENEIEEIPVPQEEVISETTVETSAEEAPISEPAKTEDIVEDKKEEEVQDEIPAPLPVFPGEPEPVAEPAPAEEIPAEPAPAVEEVPEEDDSWLKEVRMDDIDLDIQEDDE